MNAASGSSGHVATVALVKALEDAQGAGEPVDALAESVANSEAIKTEIIGDEAMGRVLVITAEPESTEATAQPESDKFTGKGRGKKGAATTD